VIVDETARLDSIVREFLDFARPREMRVQPVVVRDVVDDVLRFVASELEKRRIHCQLQVAAELAPVPADRELLYRAILNVVLNGIQAMGENGELRLELSPTGLGKGGVKIAISDSGPGIPPERQEQIFKPFYTDKIRGSGLGLAIVKNIIDGHQGRIEVVSSPGQGATFFITLGES
jgi:signal transduction histidine kinase